MNLFRPFQGGEPQKDQRGRLVGIDRYQDVLGRNWKRFTLTGLLTIVGCLPLTAGIAYALFAGSPLALVPASLAGGAIAGPFIACLYDAILRALRDAPGSWWQNYKRSLLQNTYGALIPGALTGLFLGSVAFMGGLFFIWGYAVPSTATILLYLFSSCVFLILSNLYWCQMVLFNQKVIIRLKNALLFTVRHFWATLGTALLQLLWWVFMVLFAPWTLLLLPFVGVWFALFVALFLLYKHLEDAFCIEESIAQVFPEQAPRYD